MIHASEDSECVTLSRCGYIWRNGEPSEQNAFATGKDGDIPLHGARGAYKDQADARKIVASIKQRLSAYDAMCELVEKFERLSKTQAGADCMIADTYAECADEIRDLLKRPAPEPD
jgi:hypothetical protein